MEVIGSGGKHSQTLGAVVLEAPVNDGGYKGLTQCIVLIVSCHYYR